MGRSIRCQAPCSWRLVEWLLEGRLPSGCVLSAGTVDTDESAMTGESLPVTIHEGGWQRWIGTVVGEGETSQQLALTGRNFGRATSMLGSSGGTFESQKLLLRCRYLRGVPLCLLLSTLPR